MLLAPTLNMEIGSFTEILISTDTTTRRLNPGDHNLYIPCISALQ